MDLITTEMGALLRELIKLETDHPVKDLHDYSESTLKRTSTFIEALATNGTNIQTSVTGVAANKRRFIDERRDQPFDKRLRFSVRQTESAYRYRDIVVRKQDGFTHILLSTKSSENNSLNPEVMKEVQSALNTAAVDDSKLVLLSAVGSVFCCGLDFIYFIRRLTDDRKRESTKMADAIRFVKLFKLCLTDLDNKINKIQVSP
uniref:CDYL n=1 Tax=Laticauda laticaudata TaxID=8630 RepID=A0A8C5S2Y4_LATLA